MEKHPLQGVVWGSKEYFEIIKKNERSRLIEDEIALVDDLLTSLTTDEGWEYLIESIRD